MATFNLSDSFDKFQSNTEKVAAGSTVSSGLIGTLPSFVDNNDGTFTIGDCDVLLYDNDRQEGIPLSYHITGGLIDISDTPNEVRYLFVDYNSGSPIYIAREFSWLPNWNSSDAAPIYTMYNDNNIEIHKMSWDGLGQGLADKNHRRILKTQRFARESGADLSVTDPARSIQCTSGIMWVGSIEHDMSAFNSATVGHKLYFHHYTGTGLTVDITQTGGVVDSAVVNSGGTGYYQGDVVEITGGGGTGAIISLDTVVSGVVTAISIVSGGTGYGNTTGAITYEGWTSQTFTDGSGVYNNTEYDGGDGSGVGSAGVNPVDSGDYVVNWVYRDVEGTPDAHCSIVLGEKSFGTLAEAQGSRPRTDLPPEFGVIGFLIGRIIVQQNASTADFVESAFAPEFFGAYITSHSSLSGLQGGTVDEYFHVTSAEQQHLTSGLPVCLTTYSEEPAKNAVENVHGSLVSIVGPTVLNSGSPINGTNGISKIMISVGTVTTGGTITVTGDTVNRNTGAVTVADTDVITVSTATTDSSSTDANGIDVWNFTGGYVTSKWFKDGFTISTATANLSNVEVYQLTFEQFDDKSNVIVDSIDANFKLTNVNGSFSGHFYKVDVTGSRVDILQIASQVWDAGGTNPFPSANRFYRLRNGNLNTPINGTTDGIFVTMAWLGAAPYFNDVGLKIWARIGPDIT